jgi:hypothetical protein
MSKSPKELIVSWLSNERTSVVLQKGGQRKILSIAAFSREQLYDNEEDQLMNIRAKLDAFLDRNPRFWEAP